MNFINRMIKEECYKSKKLRQLSCECGFEKGEKLREQQDKHYKKFLFLKNLSKEMEKTKKCM